MKEVTIKIVGKQVHDNIDEEEMELITEAQMFERNGVLYLIYDESEISGLEGMKTRLRLEGDTLKMSRTGTGDGASEMKFEKGKRFTNKYMTPMGPVEVEILTNDLENTMTYEGQGRVYVDYSISLSGLTEGRSKLDIEFMGDVKNDEQ